MESVFYNVTFNRTLNYSGSDSHCYYLYEYSRTFYIPLFHALVMITGLIVNLYMVIALRCACSKNSGRRKKVLSDVDVFFSHLAVCDIATLLTIPVWVTQTILVKGWVFGYVVCKLLKGVITFCFQYGILLMVYINIERYMKVVHNRTTAECLMKRRRSSRRRIVSRLCACVPALSALVDICFYTVRPISGNTMMCFDGMHPHSQVITFWVRMNICFVLPMAVLVYCNGMIVNSVRKHVNSNSFGLKMRRAQVLPFLTVTFFMCCWIPWIASTVYYRHHVECEQVKHVVLNVCVAIGNMHCITSPALYIIMRFRGGTTNSFSLRRLDTPPSRQSARRHGPGKLSANSTSNEQECNVGLKDITTQRVTCIVDVHQMNFLTAATSEHGEGSPSLHRGSTAISGQPVCQSRDTE